MIPRQFILAKRPFGVPDESVFRIEQYRLPALRAGEVWVHGLYYAVDPSMRGRLNAPCSAGGSHLRAIGPPHSTNQEDSWLPPFAVGEPIEGPVVGRVIESRCAGFRSGDFVFGHLHWATEMNVSGERLAKIDLDTSLPTEYLGVLGMPGFTAYFGLLDIGRPKEGEVIVISGAEGAVGTIVGQIAKLKGCTVVGIVGPHFRDEGGVRVQRLRDRYGFDQVINYGESFKAEQALPSQLSHPFSSHLKAICSKGIDIYFDNVGGALSDAVIPLLNDKARIVLSGQLSQVNGHETSIGPRWESLLATRSVLMQGFRARDYQSRFPEALTVLSEWLKAGKIESSQTIVEGFTNLPRALVGVFDEKNIGKMIVKAAA